MATTGSEAQVQEMYIAYYGRPADPAGLEFWAGQLDANGGNLDAIVNAFGNSDEARALYGIADLKEENQSAFLQDDAAVDGFVSAIYKQLFDRDPDALGLTFYREGLQDGTFTLQSAALDILNGAKNADGTYKGDTDGQSLENKKIVADCFTENLDESDAVDGLNEAAAYSGQAAIDIGRDLLSQFDDESDMSAAAVDAACSGSIDTLVGRDPAPGQATLTEGVDIVTANIIDAPRGFTPGGTDQVNTLNDDDVITGEGDNPTLNFDFVNDADTGDLDIQPTLNGVQTINVDVRTDGGGPGVAQLDLQDSTGVQTVNVDGIDDGNFTFTVDNMQSAEDVDLSINDANEDSASVNFLFEGSALTGDSDDVDLTLNDVDLLNVRTEDEDGLNGEALETLNVTSTGDENAVDTLFVEGAQTVNLSGDTSLELGGQVDIVNPNNLALVEASGHAAGLGNVAGSLVNIDASGMTAALDITLGTELNGNADGTSGTANQVSFVGGSVDDTVRLAVGSMVNATATDTDTLDGGDGTDTLVAYGQSIAAAAAGANLLNIEALEVRSGQDNDTADDTITVDAEAFDSLSSIYVRNEGSISSTNVSTPNEDLTLTLNNLTDDQANAITLAHSTTGNNGIVADGASGNDGAFLNINLAEATGTTAAGTAETATVNIVTNINTDPRFNAVLDIDGENAGGTADGGAVENVTLNDNDDESNTIELVKYDEHTGTITLTGGQDGQFLDLDATGNMYGRDQSGGNADGVDGLQDIGAAAAERLEAATIDATGHVGDVTVRVSESDTITATADQNIMFGVGDDTVIFDKLGDTTAGLTILDTVSGGEGDDTLAIDGNGAQVQLGASEWTNVSGMDNIQLVGLGDARGQVTYLESHSTTYSEADFIPTCADPYANAYDPVADAGYTLVLTDQLIDSTDNGSVIDIINDSGETAANDQDTAAGDRDDDSVVDRDNAIESSAVIDARALSAGNSFTYNGEENDYDPGTLSTTTSAGATQDVFIFDDASLNGSHVIDGGDELDTGLNTNSDIIEIYNTTIAADGDFANISNVGEIRVRSDQVTNQTFDITLTDAALDNFDNSQAASAAAPERVLITSPVETGAVGTKTINLNLNGVTNNFIIDVSEIDGLGVSTILNVTQGGVTTNNVTTDMGVLTFTKAPIVGTDGNETIVGTSLDDVIDAMGGNDTVCALEGDDSISAGTGDDSVDAGDGNDTVDTGTGQDTVAAGEGNNVVVATGDSVGDNISSGSGTDTITSGDGADTIASGDGADLISAGDGANTINSGDGADTVTTGDDGDTIEAGDGDDVVSSGSGNDTVDGDLGADTIDGGDGNDTLTGGDGADSIEGNTGDDSIDGGIDNDTINGGDGADAIDGNTGNDSIDGGDGDDAIEGGLGDDSILGGDGDDFIDGGDDNDTINGGSGADTIEGSGGTDSIEGGDGADSIDGGIDNDTINGGDGADTIDGNTGNDSIDGGDGDDSIDGGANADTIDGGSGADTIDGNTGLDSIDGGDGDDSIDGGGSGDTIHGGSGDDTIDGGGGADSIEGGAGSDQIDVGAAGDADVVVYTAVADMGNDGNPFADPFVDLDHVINMVNGEDHFDLTAIGAATANLEAAATNGANVAAAAATVADFNVALGGGTAWSGSDGTFDYDIFDAGGLSYLVVDLDDSGSVSTSDFIVEVTGSQGTGWTGANVVQGDFL